MAWSSRDVVIRVTLLVALSLGLLWVMSPWLKTTRTRLGASVNLQDEGVGLQVGGDGTVTIRLDGKEETIPSSGADDSKIHQEALQRLAGSATAQIGQRYEAWSWRFIRRRYLPLVALLSVVLFVAWKPRNPYVEGAV